MTSIKSTPEFELDNNGSATDGFEEISRCLCGSTYFIIIISICFAFDYLYLGVSQVDGSFHTPQWHAARLASLNTTHTITPDTDKLMREYRAQLDAERALKLSKGRNYSSDKSRKVCSIILPQSHHLGAMKTNQEDQDQVLKDQRRRISTSPAETNVSTRSKDETDGPVPLSRFFGNLKS
ncbi:unnamed protein product [Brassica oleracea var. botrytis]|uniref:(rape) hypothetical protein n=1 Tax=Brassica napus TaxID=3708 RepID=A0A816UXR4_BRANA|nr:unnamed protein product [Brassica napus]